MFNISRSKHRDSITSLFLPFLERFNPSSRVVYSEGIDQSITAFTTWIRLKSERLLLYNLDKTRPLTEISSNLSDCMVLTIFIQLKTIKLFKLIINSGITSKLIVCKSRATDPDLENICNNKYIYF